MCWLASDIQVAYNSTLRKCVQTYYSLRPETENVKAHILCAKNPHLGRSTCSGDSGGPLTVKKNGKHVLVGVTAKGFGCGLVSYISEYEIQLNI